MKTASTNSQADMVLCHICHFSYSKSSFLMRLVQCESGRHLKQADKLHFLAVAERTLKTRGEIEAAICQGISQFELEYLGRGPKDIRTHLIDDILVVRLQGVLTAAEQHLVEKVPAEKGRDLIKQVRSQLVEIARPKLEALVEGVTGIKPKSLHHDISTVSGEEFIIFTLPTSPEFRDTKRH